MCVKTRLLLSLTMVCFSYAILIEPRSLASDRTPKNVAKLWESRSRALESISLESREFVEDSDSGKNYQQTFHFTWAVGGRASLQVDTLANGVHTKIYDVRENGKTRHFLMYPRGYPDDFDSVLISHQESTYKQFKNIMFRTLWVLMPFGKPYHYLLEDGAKIYGGGSEPLVLRATEGDVSIEAILGEHDFLPDSMTISSPGGTTRIRVSKFDSINGFWLPTEGDGERTEIKGGKTESGTFNFRVLNPALNEQILDSQFGLPRIPEGVMVRNRITNKNTYVGGDDGRKKWKLNHPNPEEKKRQTIVVEEYDTSIRWELIFIVLSFLFGCLALFLRRRSM